MLCRRRSSPSTRRAPVLACATLRRRVSVFTHTFAPEPRALPPYSASACVPSLSSSSSTGLYTRDFLRLTPVSGGGCAAGPASADELDEIVVPCPSSDRRLGAPSASPAEEVLARLAAADGGCSGGSGFRILLQITQYVFQALITDTYVLSFGSA